MTTQELYKNLEYKVNAAREKRAYYANFLVKNPQLLPNLLEIMYMVDDKVSFKAAWILEFAVRQNTAFILPEIDTFLEKLEQLYLDSSVRPAAKICEELMLAYFAKKPNQVQATLTNKHLEKITEVGFDWMISQHKVAVKAYTMTSLYLLGTKIDWVHPELALILEQEYHRGSAGYKARARKILGKIKDKK